MKIMIACQCGTNKGDRAIAEYLIKELQQKGVEITLSTSRPDLWEKVLDDNINVIPMGYPYISKSSQGKLLSRITGYIQRKVLDKLLLRSMVTQSGKHFLCNKLSNDFIKKIDEMDMVIVTGGHHITSLREENAFFSYTYDIGLISLYAKRYVLWSQTIGPLEFSYDKAKCFFGNVIQKAEKVFIRDDNSNKCIQKLYGKCNNLVKTYDSVLGYGSMEIPSVLDREKKVGIAIFDGLKKAFKTYDVIARMLDFYAGQGYTIEFFRMEYNDYELENINQIISLMKQKADINIHPFLTTTEEHLKEVASCRCFIGYKTHSVIMALATATPIIAIAYHKKTEDFMHDFGLGDYVLSDENLDFVEVEKCITLLEDNMEQIHEKQRLVAQQIAQHLKKDLHEMVNNE